MEISDQLSGQTSALQIEGGIALLMGLQDVSLVRGLALSLWRNSPPDATAIWQEVAFAETKSSQWERTGAGVKQEDWENEFLASAPSTPAQEAALALAIFLEILQSEPEGGAVVKFADSQDGLSLFFAAARPAPDGNTYGEVRLSDKALGALIVQPGSAVLRTIVTRAFQFGSWAIGVVPLFRSPTAAAKDIMKQFREQREEAYPLLALDIDQPLADAELRDKRGAIIFLHGLLSTDLGTFDDFIDCWGSTKPYWLPRVENYTYQSADEELPANLQGIVKSVALIGWPHDTMCSIECNAIQLTNIIDRDFGEFDWPIAFVCHSRGGLVARATAELLFTKNPKWLSRIRGAVTFGTPHNGAELAEHPERAIGEFMLVGFGAQSLLGIVDGLAYLGNRGTLEGVRDLRPSDAPEPNFLLRLQQKEVSNSSEGPHRLPIVAIGGAYSGSGSNEPFIRRAARSYMRCYTGEDKNDLVVTLSSAQGGNTLGVPQAWNCDHFSYFDGKECTQEHFGAVIKHLWEMLGLANAAGKVIGETGKDPEGGIKRDKNTLVIKGVRVPITNSERKQ